MLFRIEREEKGIIERKRFKKEKSKDRESRSNFENFKR